MTSPGTAAGKTVAITGSSGYIGATLLRHLEEYGNLDKLVAIDTRPQTAAATMTAPPPQLP